MKLKRNNNNKKLIVIVLAIVVTLAVLGVIAWQAVEAAKDNKNQQIQSIAISDKPKSEYYVGESFDPTGLRLRVTAGTEEYSHFVDYPNNDIQISGFDSSVANDALLVTVSYMGFETTLTVKIKEVQSSLPPHLVSIEICGLITTYTKSYWNNYGPSASGAYILLTYSDGSTYGDPDSTPLSRSNIYYDHETEITEAGTTQITIKYSENGISKEETITITITD